MKFLNYDGLQTLWAKIKVYVGGHSIQGVKKNGSALTPDGNMVVDVTVPTKTSDLTNDSNFAVDASYVHTDNNYTSGEKTKLSGIEAGAEVNVIEVVKLNGVSLTPDSNKVVDVSVPTNNSQLANGAGYQTASDVQSAIASQIASVIKPKGTVAFANLPQLALDQHANQKLGFMYNISDAFTINSDFVEYDASAPKSYPAGTNVYVVQEEYNQGDVTHLAYKYDVLAGFVDLGSYYNDSNLIAITDTEINALS